MEHENEMEERKPELPTDTPLNPEMMMMRIKGQGIWKESVELYEAFSLEEVEPKGESSR